MFMYNSFLYLEWNFVGHLSSELYFLRMYDCELVDLNFSSIASIKIHIYLKNCI